MLYKSLYAIKKICTNGLNLLIQIWLDQFIIPAIMGLKENTYITRENFISWDKYIYIYIFVLTPWT